MCGATPEQKNLEAQQAQFYGDLSAHYDTVFGQTQGILQDLTANFQPIFDKGPNQKGFSPEEEAQLRSDAITGTQEGYRQATEALGERRAARGGDSIIPSGQDSEIDAMLAANAENEKTTLNNNVTLADYDAGRQLWEKAAAGLGSTAGLLNPIGSAGVANEGGADASKTANDIAQASNSLWNAAIGGLTGMAGQALGSGGALTKGNGPCHIAEVLWGVDDARTHLLRRWLREEYGTRGIGRIVVATYARHGARVAAWLRRWPWMQAAIQPLFDSGLLRAMQTRGA